MSSCQLRGQPETRAWEDRTVTADQEKARRAAADRRVDVAVIGGGMTGLALAAALGGAGCTVALVERQPIENLVEPAHDGRVTAVALASKRFLETVGIWRHVGHDATPILDIVVGEDRSPLGVHYDHRDVGTEPLGWIVENRVLRLAAMATIRARSDIVVCDGRAVRAMECDPLAARLTLDDGGTIEASLVAICEGRRSESRDRLGIGAKVWFYDQTGIVCTLRHERPHGGTAVERFFPEGPFALLPMAGGNRSSIVWALRNDMADSIRGLSDSAFASEVAERFADRLGDVEVLSPRFYYPLVLVWADSYAADRAVLVGDTAHGIHPIAGQGWNLAVRDVAAIAEIVVDRIRLGLDPGAADALERYASWRSFDSLALVAITDGINRLFANDIFPLKLLRNLGLGLVERTPPAKRFFMRHAMGLVGELPRAMRGEPL